jgi:hypothetical protein
MYVMDLLLMSLEGFKGGHCAGFHIRNKINYWDSLMIKTRTCTGESLGRVRERGRERERERESRLRLNLACAWVAFLFFAFKSLILLNKIKDEDFLSAEQCLDS